MGIPKLENIECFNLFDNPDIASKKEKLTNKRMIQFQSEIDFENMIRSFNFPYNFKIKIRKFVNVSGYISNIIRFII